MKHRPLIAALLLSLFTTCAAAQTTDSKPPPKSKAPKNAATTESEQQDRIRRGQARSLLIALSTDARTFSDPTLRARSLARIADALWQVDSEQGRMMFQKAWEAAEVADQDSETKVQEDIRQQKARNGGGGYVLNLPPNVRREVLRLVARHDRALSEDFLEKLKAQKVEKNSPLSNQSDALTQRLSVARELLEAGEVERALAFADPALTAVRIDTVDFLSDIREKSPSAADQRYSAMLTSAANNPQSDPNTVSLLSSYIFTPHLYITFSDSGTSSSQQKSEIVPADGSPELRVQFFRVAASILLKPLPVGATVPAAAGPDSKAPDTVGIDTRYLVIKRLLPFFEQFAPADILESVRAQLNALNAVITDNARKRDDEWINKGVKPDKPVADQEQALLDRVDRAKTSAERDSLYIQLAMMLAHRGDIRSRDYVFKVDDSVLRNGAQAYIDPFLAAYFVEKKQTEQALDMATKGELTHLQRVWVLTAAAKQLVKTDKDKALDLVEAASTEARRIEVSDPMLPQGLLAVANALMVVDTQRAWDATFDAVKAANSAQGFTGEDGLIAYKFEGKGSRSISSTTVSDFDVEGIFQQLAINDYDRAVELARGFQGEGPRAVATIAIAKAILEPKKTKATGSK